MDLGQATYNAAVLALSATILGWFANSVIQWYLAHTNADRQAKLQKDLEELRQQFQSTQEKRTYLLPGQLAIMDEMLQWLEDGGDVLIRNKMWTDSPLGQFFTGLIRSNVKPPHLIELEHKWRVRSPRLLTLAKGLTALHASDPIMDVHRQDRHLDELMHEFLVAVNKITNLSKGQLPQMDDAAFDEALGIQQLTMHQVEVIRRWLIYESTGP